MKFDDVFAVWIQYTSVMDRETDRQTASRGKKSQWPFSGGILSHGILT